MSSDKKRLEEVRDDLAEGKKNSACREDKA